MDAVIKLLVILFLIAANVAVCYMTYSLYKNDKELRETNKVLEEAIKAELERREQKQIN